VAASYMPRNARSGRVLERCGFRIEGTAISYLRIDGRWEDHVLTALINPDWPDEDPIPRIG
jgi:ribosomal-protein-alanine N-acetyltransferase